VLRGIADVVGVGQAVERKPDGTLDSLPLSVIDCRSVMLTEGESDSMATWLTLEEAAKHLKIGKSSLYQLAREGGIPAHKYGRVWRFDQEELDGWMKSSGDKTAKTGNDSEKENRQ